LPHAAQWQALWIALLAGGLAGLLAPWKGAALAALLLGLAMLSATVAKCLRYALRSDVHGLPAIPGLGPKASRRRYRGMIAWLHFLQPLARRGGLVRGLMTPPEVPVLEPAVASAERRWLSGPREIAAALKLLLGDTLTARFWGESWTSIETVLGGVVKELRAAGVRTIAVDDGWEHDRDVSVGLGPWARVDLRALVEEHAQGRVLLRVATRLRLTGPGVALGV